MRVQVSARSGTITPNSSEPNRVRVAASVWRKFLISWSIEMPLGPAGRACREPPWMLPGNSSMPVSRQPMPRMWLSPSPRTLSQTPCRISVRSRNGSSGVRLSLSVNLLALLVRPERRRDDAVGAEHDDQPLLARLPGWRSRGSAGSAGTARPRRRCPGRGGTRVGCVCGPCRSPPGRISSVSRRIGRTRSIGRRSSASNAAVADRGDGQGRRRDDLDHQFADVEIVLGERSSSAPAASRRRRRGSAA